eukprot:gene32774-41730_t
MPKWNSHSFIRGTHRHRPRELALSQLLSEAYDELVQICRLHDKSSYSIKRVYKYWLKEFVPSLGLVYYEDLDQGCDHRFFPVPHDIKNAIQAAAKSNRQATIDQESTLLYLADKAEKANFSWAFRSSGEQALTYTFDDSSQTIGCNLYTGNAEGQRFLERTAEVPSQ